MSVCEDRRQVAAPSQQQSLRQHRASAARARGASSPHAAGPRPIVQQRADTRVLRGALPSSRPPRQHDGRRRHQDHQQPEQPPKRRPHQRPRHRCPPRSSCRRPMRAARTRTVRSADCARSAGSSPETVSAGWMPTDSSPKISCGPISSGVVASGFLALVPMRSPSSDSVIADHQHQQTEADDVGRAAVEPEPDDVPTYQRDRQADRRSGTRWPTCGRRAVSSGAIGMEPNRRLMPCAASVAARNAPEMEANEMACSTIRGVRYCA